MSDNSGESEKRNPLIIWEFPDLESPHYSSFAGGP